jgi:two-component system cell cycle sensor histidine kinase/response regulator CckA
MVKKETGRELGQRVGERAEATILFVDDDDIVINVGRKMLKQLGYRVLIAKGGKEALDLHKKRADQIDMVILDMTMPDMNGRETFERLKKIDPDIKVLISTGYSINGEVQEILNHGGNGFLQKPFDMTVLSQKVREVLNNT